MPFGPPDWRMEWDPVEEKHELVPEGWRYYPDWGRIQEKKRIEERNRRWAEQIREEKERERNYPKLDRSLGCDFARGFYPPKDRRNCKWRCLDTALGNLCDKEYARLHGELETFLSDSGTINQPIKNAAVVSTSANSCAMQSYRPSTDFTAAYFVAAPLMMATAIADGVCHLSEHFVGDGILQYVLPVTAFIGGLACFLKGLFEM